MGFWKSEKEFDYREVYENVDAFFEELTSSKTLEYREGQHTMALDIMDAIKKREILLMEAGVGSGKSWGYLVPLIYASKEEKNFKGFIVSTSSIALQEQLQKEIKMLSKMLDINIDVVIAKGKNNFICKKRLESFLKNQPNKDKYLELSANVESGKYDKHDFDRIDNKTWDRINVTVYSKCFDCIYNNECEYMLQRKKWPSSKFVICNHDLLIEALKRDHHDKLLSIPSVLIVDEAHSLEEKIRNSYKESISKNYVEALIYDIYFRTTNSGDLCYYNEISVIPTINKVFRMISSKAKKELHRNAKVEVDVLDSNTNGFTCTKAMKDETINLIMQLKNIEKSANYCDRLDRDLLDSICKLREVREVFEDLIISPQQQKNIYWASFLPQTKEHIELQYVKKDLSKASSNLFSDDRYAKVFTSATLTTEKDDYNYFIHGLGLDKIKGIPVTQEYSQPSPYNYEENALLYCATDVLSPKTKEHELYLDSLSNKIDELINITEGKSLVLFTSKSDMKEVYNRLQKRKYSFPIFIQKEGKSAENIKQKFIEDENSTLLATGAFWEGIDVKGVSLSNVIIAKLPYPVVDPIIEEKAAYYQDGFKEVYLPEMLIKLKQGTGRLIRSASDKGIVAILDSRVCENEEYIVGNLIYSNVTSNIEDVKKFSEEKIKVKTR